MATDHYEDDLELDDELAEDEELDLEVLDETEDVDYDEDFELAPAEAEIETIEEEDTEDEEEIAEETSEDDEDLEEEEEDEETLEVLLGPDSDATVTTARSRSDDSGDAPPGEGEFTCRSCFLVKRRAQLADATAMICLDCA